MRRSPLKRKTELKRGISQLKRTPMKRAAMTHRSPSSKSLIPYRVRWAVRLRSQGWCEAATPGCPNGWHRADHLHHVLTRSLGGEHTEANLLHVCGDGHLWIHQHPATSYESGWLVHSWEVR